jgi:hypothetical protein
MVKLDLSKINLGDYYYVSNDTEQVNDLFMCTLLSNQNVFDMLKLGFPYAITGPQLFFKSNKNLKSLLSSIDDIGNVLRGDFTSSRTLYLHSQIRLKSHRKEITLKDVCTRIGQLYAHGSHFSERDGGNRTKVGTYEFPLQDEFVHTYNNFMRTFVIKQVYQDIYQDSPRKERA